MLLCSSTVTKNKRMLFRNLVDMMEQAKQVLVERCQWHRRGLPALAHAVTVDQETEEQVQKTAEHVCSAADTRIGMSCHCHFVEVCSTFGEKLGMNAITPRKEAVRIVKKQ